MILGPHMLATEFEHFARANISADAGPGQRADMQRAFYGGVLLVLNLTAILAELDDAQAVEALEEIRAEANAFALAQFLVATRLLEARP
ncbi:hypothetical protein AWB78_07819 [Caballeronia calidae]|uniref:Uncharacterized protein n=1 Tax=Caballeronia calidae TaxID=1777139 RepID=A0A158EHV9_9BURK|nr:hypothetical protein [Caballeronia calidae]SAL05996.1 hypothetical protein AWB78_07819 [Caballeronia calidae]